MTTARTTTENAAILTRAQQAMREVKTEADAHGWLHDHYYEHIENNDLKADFDAMHRAIVLRITGAGGG